MGAVDPQAHLDGLRRVITAEKCKQLLVDLVRVPSPQTALMEAEPQLRTFIETAVAPRLSAMGFADIRYDGMGNLISTVGAGTSGESLMLITNAMNQPAATMPNAYAGDIADGARFGLPGEVVLGKGASEQKANMAAMLIAMEAVLASVHSDRGPARPRVLRVRRDRQPCGHPQRDRGRGRARRYGAARRHQPDGDARQPRAASTCSSWCTARRPAFEPAARTAANAVTGAMEVIRRLTSAITSIQSTPNLGPQRR